jgi:hypothetical protein
MAINARGRFGLANRGFLPVDTGLVELDRLILQNLVLSGDVHVGMAGLTRLRKVLGVDAGQRVLRGPNIV